MEHNKVYIVFSDWVRDGEHELRKVESVCADKNDAMDIIGDLVDKDCQFGDFWDDVVFCDCFDENGRQLEDGEELPKRISHFIVKDDKPLPEFELAYYIEEYVLVGGTL